MGNAFSKLFDPPQPLEEDLNLLFDRSRGPAADSETSLLSHSSKRTASPRPVPNSKRPKGTNDDPTGVRKIPAITSLTPERIPGTSVVFAVRQKFLDQFYNTITKLNDQTRSSDETSFWYLSDGQVKRIAVIEESQAARLNPNHQIYRNVTPHRIRDLSKLDQESWKYYLQHLTAEKLIDDLHDLKKAVAQDVDAYLGEDSLQSPAHQLAVLEQLTTPIDGLEHFGYITRIPSDEEIEVRRAVVQSGTGKYVQCERCNRYFESFPGRLARGELTTGGKCQYHHGKPRQSRATGSRDAPPSYSCCQKQAGTEGCTTAEHHVFKIKDAVGMASVSQFQPTPERSLVGLPAAVAFDCEMCYTTYGMELLRLTAIEWPSKKVLIDALVRPRGEILDLNSRYSGVTPKMFTSALPHWQNVPWPVTHTPDRTTATGKALKIISSPVWARKMLFEFLGPTTPLIGHAIENDLNSKHLAPMPEV